MVINKKIPVLNNNSGYEKKKITIWGKYKITSCKSDFFSNQRFEYLTSRQI